jgi:hypothetical protein
MLEGFSALAIQLTGLKPADISQAHMPPKVLDPRRHGKIEFRVIGCRPYTGNDDEVREDYDVGTNTLILTAAGRRQLTIQVKFTGEDHRPTQDALFYLERLGSRLVWPPSRDALRALDMGLVTRGSFIDLSKVYSAEDRQGSIGVKEFIFNVLLTEQITNPDNSPFQWIQTVLISSDTLDDVDGTPLPHQISATVTVP